jgi:hypothetical protein
VFNSLIGLWPKYGSYYQHNFKPGDGNELGLNDNISDGEAMTYRLILTRASGTTYSPPFDLVWYVGTPTVQTGD